MSSMHSPTGASSMHRWKECPGSVRLCQSLPPAPPSRYAEEGTEAHAHAAAYLNLPKGFGKEFPLALDPEMVDHLTIYTDFVEGLPGKRLVEHKFDLSAVHPGLFGTCDAVVFDECTRKLHVVDLKYGAGISVEVERNPQLLYYGLGAAVTAGFVPDEIELVIVQPRCPHKEGPIRTWTCSLSELLIFGVELKRLALATEDPFAKLVPGDHCRFCPAAGVCPAIREKAQSLAKREFSTVESKGLSETLEWLPIVEAWAKRVRDFAYGEAEQGRAPKGWKLVAKRATRKWRDEASITAFLELEFPNSVPMLFEHSVKSPAQVEKVLHSRQHERLSEFIVSISSGNTLVPSNDPRSQVKKISASDEFSAMDSLDIFT